MNWKIALFANWGKCLFVLLAFALMVFLGSLCLDQVQKEQNTHNYDGVFGELDREVGDYLEGPRQAFISIFDGLEDKIAASETQEVLQDFISQEGLRLRQSRPGKDWLYGTFGIIQGKLIDPLNLYDGDLTELERESWFQKASHGVVTEFSEPHLDKRTGQMAIYLARVVIGQDNESLGVLCMVVGLGFLDEFLEKLYLAPPDYSFVVDAGGTIISHREKALVGEKIVDIDPDYLALLVPDPGLRHQSFADYDGTKVTAFAKRLKIGWTVVVVEPIGPMGPQTQRALIYLSLAGFLLAILVCALFLYQAVLRSKAEKENSAKIAFLTRISHEIRTPMNAIVGMSDLLLRNDKEMSSQCRAWSFNIKHAGDLLLSIINDMLDFSTIRSGQFKFVPLSYTLSSLVNDTINIVLVNLQEKSLAFLVFVDANLPNYLRGDVTRVRQIILNLLSNAVKYTHEGYVYLLVEGQRREEADILDLTITIKDTGIGIKEEDKARLFFDYSRLDRQKNQRVQGTGLGLTITESLCHMMDGSISFESKYGQGSSFRVKVPQEIEGAAPFALVEDLATKDVLCATIRDDYAQSYTVTLDNLAVKYTLTRNIQEFCQALDSGQKFSHVLLDDALYTSFSQKIETLFPQARLGLMSAGHPGTRAAKNISYIVGPLYSLPVANFLNNSPSALHYDSLKHRERILVPKGRVLVVDDLETNLQVARALLSEYGWHIDTTNNAKDSLLLVSKNNYDLVLMDHMMPEMDGLEAAYIIRTMENGKFKELPLVALTANVVSGMREMFLAHGFNDYISKPIDLVALDDTILRWIPSSKLHCVTDQELAAQAAQAALLEAREAMEQAEVFAHYGDHPTVPRSTVSIMAGTLVGKDPIPKVLIVDDLPTNIKVAEGLVSSFGCKVEVAQGGQEAIDTIKDSSYDLVFMDHMMPQMDGMEATRLIRQLDGCHYSQLPIVALTANIFPGAREKFLNQGFNDFIPKPIDVALLEEVLVRFIGPDRLTFPQRAQVRLSPKEKSELISEEDIFIDFQEGLSLSKGKEAYRRALEVFLHQGKEWVQALQWTDDKSLLPQDLSGLFQDIAKGAFGIGAISFSHLAKLLLESAKIGDDIYIAAHSSKFLRVLEVILFKVSQYLLENYEDDGPRGKGTLEKEKEGQDAQKPGNGQSSAPSLVDFELGLSRCRGNIESYVRLLGFYLTDIGQWQTLLKDYPDLKEIDFKTLTISFHSMKSASATIGAVLLSEDAKDLEDASRREDLQYIKDNIDSCKKSLEAVRTEVESYLTHAQGSVKE
ncbi:MAG: response regulator [Deltaproteobacteria bacterium]|jgi:CheY-like chemotaxis protein/signal transduction histidine kinase/HPt (histidine-containing phosphotransfer) domain-containing protein|nr:response regulator [Deltaproteobacteria bacterium]